LFSYFQIRRKLGGKLLKRLQPEAQVPSSEPDLSAQSLLLRHTPRWEVSDAVTHSLGKINLLFIYYFLLPSFRLNAI
jgi:hypothetical protein